MVNANADIIRKAQALGVNINAAKGLQEVLKTNLGPKGTIKMLVGGAGQVKLTKDGARLLSSPSSPWNDSYWRCVLIPRAWQATSRSGPTKWTLQETSCRCPPPRPDRAGAV